MKSFNYVLSLILYIVILSFLVIYSYALVDPNITLINNSIWVSFRETMVQLGYYQRALSWSFYLTITILLFISYRYLLIHFNKLNPVKIAFIVGGILLFSYPFLSHDLFNYIFDAKIFTFYHQNPYLHKALDYPTDEWLRFMHWTHRTYPYGAVFLVISFVPSFLSFGKFLLNFLFFKALFIGFYIAAVYYLNKINKQLALLFAVHPFILLEGLVAAHNDIIAVSLGIIGIYYLEKDKKWLSAAFLILSAGIKYLTLPIIAVRKNNPRFVIVVFITQVALLVYLCITREIQPWYFLTFFAYIPFFKNLIQNVDIFLFGLLMSYYPFIRLGEWTNDLIDLKHTIILTFLVANIVYLIYKNRKEILNYIVYKKNLSKN